MAAANAQIGVAIAAYFPTSRLSALARRRQHRARQSVHGVERALGARRRRPARRVFDGGLREAQVEAARADLRPDRRDLPPDRADGFQQVEDQLAALAHPGAAGGGRRRAVRDAREAEQLTLNQYHAGTVAYTSVITAQTTALTNEEAALAILQSRLVARWR